MKRIAIFLTALALLATGCQKGQKFTVTGDLKSAGLATYADTLLLGGESIETPYKTAVVDHAFTFTGRVEKPTYARVMVQDRENKYSKSLILEKGVITFKDGFACGTPLNDANFQFHERIQQIAQENKDDREAATKAIEAEFFSFVAQHKNDPCAIFAILRSNTFMTPEAALRLIDSASSDVQNNGNVRALKDLAKRRIEADKK